MHRLKRAQHYSFSLGIFLRYFEDIPGNQDLFHKNLVQVWKLPLPPSESPSIWEKNLSDKYGNESLMAETIFAWWNFDSTRFRPTECRFHQTPTHRMSIPPNADPRKVDSTKKTCTVFKGKDNYYQYCIWYLLIRVDFCGVDVL